MHVAVVHVPERRLVIEVDDLHAAAARLVLGADGGDPLADELGRRGDAGLARCARLERVAIGRVAVAGVRQLFFFNDPATTEIYTLSLHDALPNSPTQR